MISSATPVSSVNTDKSEDDLERESQLLECRLTLTEERNAVLVPSDGSGIPGAPVERCVCQCGFVSSPTESSSRFFVCFFPSRVPVPGMETHIPVLFLDLSGIWSAILVTLLMAQSMVNSRP